MKKLFAFTLSFLVIILSANSQPESSDQSDSDWTTYQTNEFSIEYPEDWNLNTDGFMGSSFFLFSPLSDLFDDFRDNISLVKEDISAYNIDFEGYVNASKKQIKALITDSKIVSEERKNANGLEFHEMIYTGKQGEYDLIITQRFWVFNDMAYIVTFTCKSDVEDELKTLGTKVINTITINPNFEDSEEDDSEEIVEEEYTTYLSDQFSIQYPNDWQSENNGHLGTTLILYAPTSSIDSDDLFRENVNIMIHDISEYDMSLEDYVDLSLVQLKNMISDVNIISIREKTQDELTYYQILATGKQGEKVIKFKQRYFLVKDIIYVFSFTSEIEVFDKNLSAADTIMASFKIK